MKNITISGVVFKAIKPEPCDRLVQFFKGLPVTCACTRCASRNQTPAEALASLRAAHGL